MDGFEKAMYMLPGRIRQEAEKYKALPVEEIRLRSGRRPGLIIGGEEQSLACAELSAQELDRVLECASAASLHAVQDELRQGFLSYMGLRIGVCGRVIRKDESIQGFKSLSSLNIRIPRECRGICDRLIGQIYPKGFESSLIISPPGGGKTTALRELIRKLSDSGRRVSVVDDRNELSAGDRSGIHFDLGRCSDVLLEAPKAEGALLLLRSMNPEIIAMDEISTPADAEAVGKIIGCGVKILASAHGENADELCTRPVYRELLAMKAFKYIIRISGRGSDRQYEAERI